MTKGRNPLGFNGGRNEDNISYFYDHIEEAEAMRQDGMPYHAIADKFKVSKALVQKQLKHLTEETTETRIKALLENERIKLLTMRW